jgi:hypothetical protein
MSPISVAAPEFRTHAHEKPSCFATITLPKTNNFDLIRLAAALQVALIHALAGLGIAAAAWRPARDCRLVSRRADFLLHKRLSDQQVI